MANGVKAMDPISSATVFTRHDKRSCGQCRSSCPSDVCVFWQMRQAPWHVKGSLVQTWTQQQLINFLVAHVSFAVILSQVLQRQRAALHHTSFAPGILWCLRRLDVSVGRSSVRTCLTI